MFLLKPVHCRTLDTLLMGHKPEFLSESCVTVTQWGLKSIHESLTQPTAVRHPHWNWFTLTLREF
ncbi:hypothetical protein FHS57_005925 [Runella defluvii]|uniref:Uncharacterized protein n=1 Tax=Runella defluvii TaxID=370973 RepID=A0A7W5ZS45_9BACT|nr:hypothetical protein [Runella defluvii]